VDPAERRRNRSGGCTFCGARLALQPITDVAHLMHGALICQGHSWEARPTASSGSHLHRLNFSTGLGAREVVFGGERRLVEAVVEVVAGHQPAAVFVYQTCIPALIGDDLVAACRVAAARVGRPVIPISFSGSGSGKNHGVWSAGGVLLERVIGTAEPAERTTTDILLLGEYNVAGEVAAIRALLAALGIRVLASIPGDGRYHEIAAAHRARAAIALCSRSLAGLAQPLQARYGMPFISGSFYGSGATSDTLRALAALLVQQGAPADLPARTETLIRQEESRLEAALAPLRPALAGRRVWLASGGTKAWSLVATLQQLGLEVVATAVHKTSAAELARAAALLGPERLCGGGTDGREPGFEPGTVDLVLSGGPGRYQALKAGAGWVEINHERTFALAGYDGTLRLAQALEQALARRLALALQPPWMSGTDS